MLRGIEHEMRGRCEDILLGLTCGCLLVDYAGTIYFANAQAARLTGYEPKELVGLALPDLMPDPDRLVRRQMGLNVLRGERVDQMSAWRCKDGASVSVLMTALPVDLYGEPLAMVLVSEASHFAPQGSRSLELSLIKDLSLTSALLVTQPDTAQTLNCVAAQLGKLTDAEISLIYAYDAKTGELVLTAAQGVSTDVLGARLGPGAGIVGRCLRLGQMINLARVGDSPHLVDVHATYGVDAVQYKDMPFLAVPLEYHQERLGVLGLLQPASGRRFNDMDEQIASLYAHQIALALAQSKLYAQARSSSEALSEANRRLRSIDRMKEDFMTMISHELQQPLATARLGLDLVLHDEPELDEGQRDLLVRSLRSLDSLYVMLADVLLLTDHHGPDVAFHDVVDLTDVVRGVFEDKAEAARNKGLHIRMESPGIPMLITVPPSPLGRIVQHLVDNAIKFTSSGSITIRVHRDDLNRVAVLEVIDTGIGISADQIRRIFEAFYQADGSSRRVYDGIGLGLAVVRQVVEIYGGRVSVHSDMGKGSRFVVSFALASDT